MKHEHVFQEHPTGGLVCHGCNSFFGVEWATEALIVLREVATESHDMQWLKDEARAVIGEPPWYCEAPDTCEGACGECRAEAGIG